MFLPSCATIWDLILKTRWAIAGLGIGAHLAHWGFPLEKIREGDWFNAFTLAPSLAWPCTRFPRGTTSVARWNAARHYGLALSSRPTAVDCSSAAIPATACISRRSPSDSKVFGRSPRGPVGVFQCRISRTKSTKARNGAGRFCLPEKYRNGPEKLGHQGSSTVSSSPLSMYGRSQSSKR